MIPLQTPTGGGAEPDQAETAQAGPTADAGQQNSAVPPPEEPRPRARRGVRYEYLEQHELIMLLDEINDERSRARFREAVYIAIIFWLIFGVTLVYAPRYFWHPPHVINAPDNERRSTMTYLDTPPNLQKQLKRMTPAPNISTQTAESQSPKPSPKQMAEPKAGAPAAPAARPAPAPAPAQQQAPQPAQQQPQQQARNAPPTPAPPAPKPPPVADAPSPSANRNIFGGHRRVYFHDVRGAQDARNRGDVSDKIETASFVETRVEKVSRIHNQ